MASKEKKGSGPKSTGLLETYKQKRNFKQTSEPEGGKAAHGKPLTFVVQRHDASRLHWDFRLELEGVLKSWAVPKGPSLNPGDKRLAMQVEDHPLDYGGFSGIIPEGNYGAGEVEIWDEGTYTAIGVPDRKQAEKMLLDELDKGSMKFVLNGHKLKGEFALVRMQNHTGSGHPWLLIKHKDDDATDEPYYADDHKPLTNTAAKLNKGKKPKDTKATTKKERAASAHLYSEKLDPSENLQDDAHRSLLKKAPMPHEVKPMLATLGGAAFDDGEYVFEIKFDGYRAMAEVRDGNVELYSRNLKSFNEKYPPVREALESLSRDCVLDGEIVVLDERGRSDFQLLQDYANGPGHSLYYYVFDVLYLNGYDLRSLPLLERKHLLEQIVPADSIIRYSSHIAEQGKAFFKKAEQAGLEGIIGKKTDEPYLMGRRSSTWLKIKTGFRQEAVVIGFTEPTGSRSHIGSLVLATYEDGEWNYVGNCGTGFNAKSLADIAKKLKPLITDVSPFSHRIVGKTAITWVKPSLVCEVAFTEWTADGSMRHPSFKGLRIDKDPKDVHREVPIKECKTHSGTKSWRSNRREEPAHYEKAASRVAEAAPSRMNRNAHPKTHSKAEKAENGNPGASSSDSKAMATKMLALTVDRHPIKISNPTKVWWPEEGYTKRDVVEYYQKVSKHILPYLKDRPENLLRHPNGIAKPAFFHKDMQDGLPGWARTEEIYSDSNDRNLNYLICNDAATLAYMNNLGCIEINPWNSRIQSLDKPDYIVIDLDPADNTFEEVIEVAQAVKQVLDRAGITGYPKTSGSSGIHIYIPMGASYTYEQAGIFAQILAQLTHALLPKLTSVERAVAKRPKQIYVDYLQNRGGQTLASVYSVRPKPGATVSTPLDWDEVKSGLHPSQFTIKNIFERVEKKGDLFKPVLGKGVDIEKAMKKLKG